jgi:hypothetical protein
MTQEEVIQFYKKYPGRNVIDSTEWQKEVVYMGRFIVTLSMMIEKDYPEDKVEDYILFMGNTEERKMYLEYARDCFKRCDFSLLYG